MGFRDSILAGVRLIRQAIQSDPYTPGVVGWSINRDGTAEFNDITARGDISASSVNVTDGSEALRIVTTDWITGPRIEFETGHADESAEAFVDVNGSGAQPEMRLRSPEFGSNPVGGITLKGQNAAGTLPEHVEIVGTLEAGDMAPTIAENGTAVGIAASATYVDEGANRVSIVFVAPASGRVEITAYAVLRLELSAAVLRAMYMSFEVREGTTVGSGTVVFSPSDNVSVSTRIDAANIEVGIAADVSYPISGLTPGASYNVRTMGRVSATGSFTTAQNAFRRLILEPKM